MKWISVFTLLAAVNLLGATAPEEETPIIDITTTGVMSGNFTIRYHGTLCDVWKGEQGNLVTLEGIPPQDGIVRDSGTMPGDCRFTAIEYLSNSQIQRRRRTLIQRTAPGTGLLIVMDEWISENPVQAQWQINTINKPQNVGNDLMIRTSTGNHQGARMIIQMIAPPPDQRTVAFFGDATTDAPDGYRNFFYGQKKTGRQLFIAVLQIGNLESQTALISHRITDTLVNLEIGPLKLSLPRLP